MRCKASIDVLASVENCWALVMTSTLEHTIWIVSANCAFQRSGETWFLCQSVHVNGMEPVTAIWNTFDLTALIDIGFGGDVPGVSSWIDNTCGLHAV